MGLLATAADVGAASLRVRADPAAHPGLRGPGGLRPGAAVRDRGLQLRPPGRAVPRGYFRYAPELVDYLLSVPPTQRLRIQGLQGGRWQHFRADAVWPFADELWLAWEAKSDEVPNAEISAATVRQANTHLSGAAADLRQQIPPGSRTLIATPRAEIHPSATPLLADNVHRVGVDQVLALAEDTVRAWRAVRARASGLSHDELRQVFTEDFRSRTILASQLLQRLVE